MQEIKVVLTEPEAESLRALAEQAGISVEEAASRAVRYVLKEVMPVNPQFYELLCLPLVVLASLIYPDDRNFSLPERIVEDVREWWRLMRAEV
jgi:hypothetical protein